MLSPICFTRGLPTLLPKSFTSKEAYLSPEDSTRIPGGNGCSKKHGKLRTQFVYGPCRIILLLVSRYLSRKSLNHLLPTHWRNPDASYWSQPATLPADKIRDSHTEYNQDGDGCLGGVSFQACYLVHWWRLHFSAGESCWIWLKFRMESCSLLPKLSCTLRYPPHLLGNDFLVCFFLFRRAWCSPRTPDHWNIEAGVAISYREGFFKILCSCFLT